MTSFLIILALIICVLLVLVVLVQNPKGGGLASNFASSNQIMGVKKTTDFLEKATWTLAVALLVICLAVNMFKPSSDESPVQESAIQEQIDNSSTATPPAAAPSASPAAAPAAADTTK
jgi:preprotein translocase subunit SecG